MEPIITEHTKQMQQNTVYGTNNNSLQNKSNKKQYVEPITTKLTKQKQ